MSVPRKEVYVFYELYVAGLLTYHRLEQMLNCSLKIRIRINLVHCTKLLEKELLQQISVSKSVKPGLFLACTETSEYPKFNTFASSHIPNYEALCTKFHTTNQASTPSTRNSQTQKGRQDHVYLFGFQSRVPARKVSFFTVYPQRISFSHILHLCTCKIVRLANTSDTQTEKTAAVPLLNNHLPRRGKNSKAGYIIFKYTCNIDACSFHHTPFLLSGV